MHRPLCLFISFLLLLTALAFPAAADAAPTRKLIIDTDTGADDGSALILAAKSPEAEILGVTVLAGNVTLEQSAANALMALETAGSQAPVYLGSDTRYTGEEIHAFSVFGEDGMGDNGLIHPSREPEQGNAVDFIIETVKKYPGEVEIIALGPATNVALAIQRDPEAMKGAKMIWSMGTSGLGPGNASPVAEFNVYADPEAYKALLDSGIPVTIVGLDMCGGAAQWTDEQFIRLASSGDIGAFVASSFDGIRAFYAANGSSGAVSNCDCLAMMCALEPDFVQETVSCHGSCVTDEGECRGQVIFYREGFTYDKVENDFVYNVTLVTAVRADMYFDGFLKAME